MKNTKINYTIFAINFLSSLICLFACLFVLIIPFFGAGRPFAFVGGILFCPFPVIVLIMEWKGTICKEHKSLFSLGILSIIFAAFISFAFITNTYEAFQDWNETSKEFLLIFGPICGVLVAYSIFAGVYRIKFCKNLNQNTSIESDCTAIPIDN